MTSFTNQWKLSVFFGLAVGSGLGWWALNGGLPAPQRAPASDNRPLTVYMVHGLGGKPVSFCDTGSMLAEGVKRQTGRDLRMVALDYDTEKSGASPMQLVKQVYSQIQNDLQNAGMGMDAPYSMLLHSQAGNFALIYAQSCLLAKACGPGEIPTNLKHLVTLGSPFWGAPVASSLTFANILNDQMHLPRVQLEEMATGSQTSVRNRNFLLNPSSNPWRSPLPNNVSLYSIAGDLSSTKLLGGIFNANSQGIVETDATVDVSSARPDFNYYIELPTKDQIKSRQGRIRVANDYRLFIMTHINLAGYRGIACVHRPDFDHPGMQYMTELFTRYYRGDEHPDMRAWQPRSNRDIVEGAQTFSVELQIKRPGSYLRSLPVDGNIDIVPQNAMEFSRLETPNFLGLTYEGVNNESLISKYHARQTFFHTGNFAQKKSLAAIESGSADRKLKYRVHIPGWRVKEFELPVTPTLTTYGEIYIEPWTPFSLIGDNQPANGIDPRLIFGGGAVLVSLLDDKQSVRALYINPQDAQGVLEQKTFSRAEFKTKIGSSNPDALLPRRNFCAYGVMGRVQGVNRNDVYREFGDTNPITNFDAGQRVTVLGRMHRGAIARLGTYAWAQKDRYLIRSVRLNTPGHLGWIQTADVDLMENENCALDGAGFRADYPEGK
ncbi:MAG: hypothetical protein JST16_09100 [Bdellovibrionales bacterium]|nr:hypothetical protein [Bdellovibrionales bacterium]